MADVVAPTVTVSAGEETTQLTGRLAAIVGLMVVHRRRIEATEVGELLVRFAHAQVKLELRESLPAVKLTF